MKAAEFKSEDEAEFDPKGDTGVFLEDAFDASQPVDVFKDNRGPEDVCSVSLEAARYQT